MQSSGRILRVVLAWSVALVAAPAVASAAEPPPPPGANVPCTPSAAHPEPVVLVHGTFLNRSNSWVTLSPALKARGFCVYALDYGAYRRSDELTVYGLGPIERSAEQLRVFVDGVLRRTGAKKVDIVGHSQGGMMPRYYIKQLGGERKVDDLVGISPSNHGTTNPLAEPVGPVCPACAQQAANSAFISALNAGDETPGRVDYTVIATRYDEVVTPVASQFLAGARNLTLQDRWPGDLSEHLLIPYSRNVVTLVSEVL